MANIDVYSLTLPNDNNAYWLKDKSLQDAKGAANGIAELDSTGKVPSSQLPEIPSGGHTIKNSAGTSMTQRENLQFVDATVSDDSTNDVTKVENVHIINSESELTNAPDGLYMGSYDDAGDAIGASDVEYSNTTSGMASTDVQSAIDEIVAMKGANSGLAELDAAGKVPSAQLPSYVDDVIEVADYSHLPITGETGKIYVTIDDNKTYRWSGTGYTEISASLALGETSSTAYRGDRGKTAYNHATESGKISAAVSSGLYKIAATAQGHVAGLTAVQKADITALGISGSDTKNTAGSTDTSSKIFLVGATSQAANPQTYSDDEVYATSGTLSSKKVDTKAIIALTGTGTAGSDKGSGVSPRYIPSLWTFNSGVTVANGEVYFIKIPVAGGTYGVWLSLNNGTNYYPVAVNSGKARFTTQYGANTVIAVTYESAGVCTCFPKTGGDSTSDVTGIFRVLNDYDGNTTYSAMSTSELTTGTATSSRVVRADYLKSGINSLIDTKIGALDVTGGTNTAGKTVKAWSETDGKISLSFQDISITKSQVGLGNVDNTSDNTKKSNFTGSIAASNTGFVTGGDVYSALGDKVDKVDGKGLSTNDYTTAEKNKLSGIASGAEVNVQSDWSQSDNTKDDYIKNKPTKVSQFTNDSGFTKVESSETNGNIKINGTETQVYDETIGNLSGSHTGICETAAATSAKIVTIGDGTWIPKEGDIIAVKFTYSNTTSFVTLNVNGIGNKSIWYGDSVDPSGADYICGKAGSYIFYMYDGTYWIWLNEGKHDGNNFPSVAVYTLSNQQIKIGTCNYYTLTNKSYCHFIFRYPNSYKGELFIKINNSSSKTIYINGEISSSTNYTLPAGTYIAYYENDKWYFRTDGKLTANITGTAASDSTKADKVASATNGNLAGLNASGNLTDSGWASDKTTTSASGNPISITGLKSNQLAVNPVITFEPIQDLHGQSNPYPAGGGRNLLSIDNVGSGTSSGVTYTEYEDGKITANGTSKSSAGACYRDVMTSLHNLEPGSSYKIASNGNVLFQVLQYVNGSWSQLVGATIGPQGFTISSSATNLLVRAVGDTGTVYTNAVSYPVIVKNTETDTSFAPYENICEISDYDKIEVLSCGKNICDVSKAKSIDVSSGTMRNGLIIFLHSGYYTISRTTGDNLYYGIKNRNEDSFVTTGSVALNSNVVINVSDNQLLYLWVDNNSYISRIDNLQVEEGQTATTYESCNKTTDLSEPLPQTVYGMTLYPREGKGVITKLGIDLSTITWTLSGSSGSYYWQSTTAISNIKKPSNNQETPTWIKFEKFTPVRLTAIAGNNGHGALNVNGVVFVCVGATDSTTPPSGKMVYELAEPIEIQLTPHEISLLKDYSYVSTNGTSIALDYHNGEIATLGDVAQLGETVNEIGNGLFKTIKITRSYGNVTSGTRYSYCITDDYPFINNDSIIGLSHKAAGGSQSYDYNGLVNWVDSNNKIYISYVCQLTQNNVSMDIYILYK